MFADSKDPIKINKMTRKDAKFLAK